MSGVRDLPTSATEEPRKLVGVTMPPAAGARARLLKALEDVIPVTFQTRVPTELDGLDGLLIVSEGEPDASLRALALRAGCPSLTMHAPRADMDLQGGLVQFARDLQVARPLRGRGLAEDHVNVGCPERPGDGDAVLASVDGIPVWWASRNARTGDARAWAHVSAFVPRELGEREALREHLRVGRFMGLLPLLHFLWRLCEQDVGEQPLKAAFVIDDPNLHRASYGHINYAELLAEAKCHGYHAAFATVPLDGWLANARAAELLRDNPSAISLLMHGNDHTTEELGRLTDERRAQVALSQALRRVATLERRCGLPVERVMVPPHEVCATTALETMFRLGFDAACIGRGHPWIKSQSTSPLWWPLVKWFPTDVVGGGLPIVPRYPLDQPWGDLAFRALLGQPLILFAHHWDFAGGLDVLARATEYVNGLGAVQWCSVGSIARGSYTLKYLPDRMVVHMYSRRMTLEIPEHVSSLEVRAPRVSTHEPFRYLLCDGARISMTSAGMGRDGWVCAPRPVVPGSTLRLAMAADRPLDPAEVGAGGSTAWPLMRRALVEGRDRLQPLQSRLGLR